MRIWRDVVGDRLLGGVLGVVLLLSFAFQLADASRAAAAVMSPGPLTVLCTSSGGVAHRPLREHGAKPCPCAELCAAGLHVQSVTDPSQTSGIPIRFADRIEIAADGAAPLTSHPSGRTYEARGPPRHDEPT
ncbi:hypothetical protein [Aureimonas jatrophae]|uniref:DUF2946 domain-containing protein n=1 Tax=Aureimonas jatrophae TaxID=1166073 RepID=A0A1H0HBD5_9HYPH|nr:hypothetical protein [Aureimonas jatrophae]MBB3950504.1 hypothetical protein [Aureimonas jatrophae]SDO16499.1 hypothetical protein SAMN05192530_10412 [Aureimonas jatrophae]